MRILLIDDDPVVTENLAIYLEDEFHTIEKLHFVRLPEDLEKVLDSFQPEGIVLDFEIPPTGGQEIYGWIRGWSDEVRIVFYTRYAQSPDRRAKMLAVGATEQEIYLKREVGQDARELLSYLRGSE